MLDEFDGRLRHRSGSRRSGALPFFSCTAAGKARRDAHEAAQDLAGLTEVQAWVDALHEVEHVAALGRRAVVTPVLERTSCACFRVEFPSWDDALVALTLTVRHGFGENGHPR